MQNKIFYELLEELNLLEPGIVDELLEIKHPYRRTEDAREQGELLLRAAFVYFRRRVNFKPIPYPKPAARLFKRCPGKKHPVFDSHRAYYLVVVRSKLDAAHLIEALARLGIAAYRFYTIVDTHEYGLFIPTRAEIGAAINNKSKVSGRIGKILQEHHFEKLIIHGVYYSGLAEQTDLQHLENYDCVRLSLPTNELLGLSKHVESYRIIYPHWYPADRDHGYVPHQNWYDFFKTKGREFRIYNRVILSGYGVLSAKLLERVQPILKF